jgi:hypothetical protein
MESEVIIRNGVEYKIRRPTEQILRVRDCALQASRNEIPNIELSEKSQDRMYILFGALDWLIGVDEDVTDNLKSIERAMTEMGCVNNDGTHINLTEWPVLE